MLILPYTFARGKIFYLLKQENHHPNACIDKIFLLFQGLAETMTVTDDGKKLSDLHATTSLYADILDGLCYDLYAIWEKYQVSDKLFSSHMWDQNQVIW